MSTKKKLAKKKAKIRALKEKNRNLVQAMLNPDKAQGLPQLTPRAQMLQRLAMGQQQQPQSIQPYMALKQKNDETEQSRKQLEKSMEDEKIRKDEERKKLADTKAKQKELKKENKEKDKQIAEQDKQIAIMEKDKEKAEKLNAQLIT